ncbi:MAG: hypothetical protein KJ811_04280, partial [Candidatus Margulisbacteria bacterium]|nr:hypothetical protein [Candidatus Margulisiibacteriota bacterium]
MLTSLLTLVAKDPVTKSISRQMAGIPTDGNIYGLNGDENLTVTDPQGNVLWDGTKPSANRSKLAQILPDDVLLHNVNFKGPVNIKLGAENNSNIVLLN